MLQKSINKGVEYLVTQQQKDGSFLSLSSPNPRNFAKAKKYHTIFPAFLVLSCLNAVEETPKMKTIKRKTAKFLLSQKSKHWSFNYWARNSKEAKTLPYPDDLDDTSCALSALYQYNPKLIDGSVMAKMVTLLTAVERKEGGPYRTWLVPLNAEAVWKDVDLVVNSNIAYFLSLQDILLPNIKALIELAIETENYVSPYYPSFYPVIYFISRWYRSEKVKRITNFLFSKRQAKGRWNNPLNTALAVSALINFGVSPKKLKESIYYLIRRQQRGTWKAYPLVTEFIGKKKTYYAGSPALTTAFCVEALAKYQKIISHQSQIKKPRKQRTRVIEESEKNYRQVIKRVKQRFSVVDVDLKRQALKQLNKTLKGDKDKQIVLMPFFFKASLGKNGEDVADNLLVQLGTINLYGWIAYGIYDDFLDEEGDPKLLSVANLCLRESTTIFNSILPPKSKFHLFLQQVVDTIDAANTWEVTHCRVNPKNLLTKNLKSLKIPDYNNYSKLAERSLGHALGPIAILFSLGYKASSLEVKNLMKFFKHYLIARQLNDDAHDWEKDLKMGHINAVGAEILKNLKTEKPRIAQAQGGKLKNKRAKKDFYLLQEIFWYEVVVNICDEVLKHAQKARDHIKKVSVVNNVAIFEKILVPIEKSALKALKEREETLRFIKSYSQTEEMI